MCAHQTQLQTKSRSYSQNRYCDYRPAAGVDRAASSRLWCSSARLSSAAIEKDCANLTTCSATHAETSCVSVLHATCFLKNLPGGESIDRKQPTAPSVFCMSDVSSGHGERRFACHGRSQLQALRESSVGRTSREAASSDGSSGGGGGGRCKKLTNS